MRLKFLGFSVAVALGALACGQPSTQTCGPYCQGCCADGVCQDGTAGQACGKGGAACTACGTDQICSTGQCTTPSCTPKTCDQLGFDCGQADDGCGGTVECGTCATGKTCGAQNKPNVCGTGTCTPTTCTLQGRDCGSLADGCGTMLNCGSCPTGETCGGGGEPGVCAAGTCTPKTCLQLGKDCGEVLDGCGNTKSCGTCQSPKVCGGGGVANVCGVGACVPKTCGQLGKQCGNVDDGCGNTVPCGDCTGFQTCGGAGTPNVCGAQCLQTCPQGFTCDAQGVCSGGNLGSLVLDVPVPPQHLVGGRVTVNGSAPVANWCQYGGGIRFHHVTESKYDASTSFECEGATAWTFTVQLYPGTYEVTVTEGGYMDSNLPSWETKVTSTFTVSGAVSGVVFDVPVPPQHLVGGRVTVNGSAPVANWCQYGGGIRFHHVTESKYDASTSFECEGASAWTFTAQLYPGTYEVTVTEGGYMDSNLPSWETKVTSTFTVSGAMSGVIFDVPVPPQHLVGGRVTVNGSAPVANWCQYGGGIRFHHVTESKYDASASFECEGASAWTFTVQLYPGTYEVTVTEGGYMDSNLPAWETKVTSTFTVSGAVSGVVFDVPVPPQHTVTGRVTVNGAAPVAAWCQYGGGIRFHHVTESKYDASASFECEGATAWTFTVQLYPGTYEVTVTEGGYMDSNLPAWETKVTSTFTVSGAVSGVVFDVPVPPQHLVGGRVTVNGAAPVANWCQYGGGIRFHHVTESKYDASTSFECEGTSAWAFTVQLYPGTYEVTVTEGGYMDSNLPSWETKVTSTFTVNGALSGVVFDVPVPAQHTVTGRVTVNGAAPVANWCQYGGGIRFHHLIESKYDASTSFECEGSSAWTFTVLLYPGTYEVTVTEGGYMDSNLPSWDTVVVGRLQVP